MLKLYDISDAIGRWRLPGILIMVGFIVFLLTSCIRDDTETPVLPVGAQLTLSVQVPGGNRSNDDNVSDSAGEGNSAPGTRAMPADEVRIDEVYVFLFHPGGVLEGAYPGSTPQSHPTIPGRQSFTVKLPEGTFDVMVLANSQAFIASAGLTPGMTHTQVSAALTLRQTGKWNVAGSDLFPFWGEMKNAVLQKNGTLGVIPLNRAVAKIDIVSSDAVKNDFTLQTIAVYHWQEYMALIPDDGTMQGDEVVKATRTGTALNLYPASGKMTYTGGDISGGGITSKIYLNETPNPGSGDFPVMPCIVVGGQLSGQTGLRYYRLDLSTTAADGTRTYRDLLRNHHYNITLTDVLTNGSATEEEAYESATVDIEADIQEWEEGQLKNIIIDGEYWLRVDPAEFTLAREAHAATPGTRAERFGLDDYFFEIESNTEWKIDPNTIVYTPSEENDWFNLNNRGVNTDWSGAADTVADMEIVVTDNLTGEDRKATFTVVAGTIRFPVTVTQTPETMVTITITGISHPDPYMSQHLSMELEGEPHIIEFDIEWTPAELDCVVGVSPFMGSRITEVESGLSDGEVLRGGRKHIRAVIKPDVEPLPTEEMMSEPLRGLFSFTVGDVTEMFIATCYRYIMVNHANPSPYRMDMPDHRLRLLTNMCFRVKSVRDEYGILTPACKQRLENMESPPENYLMVNQIRFHNCDLEFVTSAPELDGKKAIVQIEYNLGFSGEMRTFDIEIEAYHLQPNSYMLKPGESVHIPVRKAFRAWSQYPMNSQIPQGTLGCEIVWESAPGLVMEHRLTPVYPEKNIDSEIYIRTDPSAVEGNALVALTMDGNIVWSWHIWVTGYDPDQDNYTYVNMTGDTYTTFMDRNLGAFSNNPATDNNKRRAQGLMYQWGRKDPFPPAADINDPARRTLQGNHENVYYPSGRSAFGSVPAGSWSEPIEAYKYSVENPTLHIGSNSSLYHWTVDDTHLWYLNPEGVYHKTEFDPCPEGWSVALGSNPWGGATPLEDNFFFVPLPEEVGNQFGYIRVDDYYIPASGYIDEEGYYYDVGYWGGSYTSRRGVADGIDRGVTLSVDYPQDQSLIVFGQRLVNKSTARNVRCSRTDR
ncbi:MAG: hypothetical protein LUF87_07020 [Alistipes sp.]|nr:hypothetical protein [Alistipes sp.]